MLFEPFFYLFFKENKAGVTVFVCRYTFHYVFGNIHLVRMLIRMRSHAKLFIEFSRLHHTIYHIYGFICFDVSMEPDSED